MRIVVATFILLATCLGCERPWIEPTEWWVTCTLNDEKLYDGPGLAAEISEDGMVLEIRIKSGTKEVHRLQYNDRVSCKEFKKKSGRSNNEKYNK